MLNSVKAFESQILNSLQYGGVVGAFNCQGAGWDPRSQRAKTQRLPQVLQGNFWFSACWWNRMEAEANGFGQRVFSIPQPGWGTNIEDPKVCSNENHSPSIFFWAFSFVPIMKLNHTTKFAPIGLTNMFNCGGTIPGLRYNTSRYRPTAESKVKGGGNFLAYSSERPKKCYLNGAGVDFEWLAGINGIFLWLKRLVASLM